MLAGSASVWLSVSINSLEMRRQRSGGRRFESGWPLKPPSSAAALAQYGGQLSELPVARCKIA
jgi:hypothetical protein